MNRLWEPRERYYSRSSKHKLWPLREKRWSWSRFRKMLRQTLASLLIFMLIWGVFCFEAPAMVPVQKKIKDWFTQDYDPEPVIKFFSSVGLWGNTLDRAAFEVVSTTVVTEPLTVPVSGQIGKPFGWLVQPDRSRVFHDGITIIAKEGTPIKAALGGTVSRIGNEEELGRIIVICSEGGIITRYAYCKEILVNLNDEVREGQVIARVGKTGRATYPQLFFSVSVKGQPTDPTKFFMPAASRL
ncbi:MAG: M23 family metallopeptidase [Clostridia bacterium]|jgi:murein DD-endopeptidase MepM/ murein hydrolase activator NlpD|nr:M23 family metallopeptidase [Clostridia bacterium]